LVGLVSLAFAVYAIFNGGPLILEWIYPTAGIAGVGVLVSYFTAPETRGRSLHEAVWL
jgi:uncharacterized membrane protein YuzA (DUF378 family)